MIKPLSSRARILKLVALISPPSLPSSFSPVPCGAGDTRATAVVTFLTVLLVRPSLAILTINAFGWGLDGAWIALVCDQLLRSLNPAALPFREMEENPHKVRHIP